MTPKQLEKLKPGALLKIGESDKKAWNENAYDLCSIRGMIDSEEYAIYYMIRKCIANGLPYTATFQRYVPDCGDGPGAQLEITVGPFKDKTIVSHKNLTLIGPHLNRSYKTHRHIAKEA